jgi:membrane associated rhomboid family serine protease
VTQAAPDTHDAPIWARPEAFPCAPQGWGWVDFKKKSHPCDSSEALITAIRDDRAESVDLVWIPGHDHLILPEEMPDAAAAVLATRQRHAAEDLLEAIAKLRWFGGLLAGLTLYMFYQGWAYAAPLAPTGQRLNFAVHAVLTSMSMGITLLMFLIFAFIPWYQTRKRLRELGQWTHGDITAGIPLLRFETWLAWQKAPVTTAILGLLAVVALAQMFSEQRSAGVLALLSLFHNWDGTAAAGLVKDRFLHGEWWRLFTAPLVHGNVVHFLMNASALLYLGKRMEVFARWPHVPLVFLFAACIGGESSTRFITAPSVGASGGLMGCLGFLLVFESLHSRLVPRTAKRRLLAGVILTAILGLIGFRFIDNAAHLGGLLAGMLYAIIVFPKSTSPSRPGTTITDRIAGSAALAVLTLAALLACRQILAA